MTEVVGAEVHCIEVLTEKARKRGNKPGYFIRRNIRSRLTAGLTLLAVRSTAAKLSGGEQSLELHKHMLSRQLHESPFMLFGMTTINSAVTLPNSGDRLDLVMSHLLRCHPAMMLKV